jgi:uncharacterized protein (DUF169 family)
VSSFEKPRGSQENIKHARQIEEHLRISTLPVGVKFYKKGEEIPDGVGEKPDFKGTFCQFVSHARYERCQIRKNYLLERRHITCPFAPGLLGFEEWTGHVVTGEHMGGVHFENAEAARKSLLGVPRVEPFTMQAVLVGPLYDLTVEPDIIMFAVVPGMTNKVLDGQMWNSGEPKHIVYYNVAGICGSGAAQAYINNDLFISFPCHGGRRIGLFTDTELLVALNAGFFDEWVLGMEKSYASGHSYPVGHMLRPNPPLPPHFKIVAWPDKIMPLGEWERQQDEKRKA